jgi:ribonucleoside-diphosphate reductase alpha chain
MKIEATFAKNGDPYVGIVFEDRISRIYDPKTGAIVAESKATVPSTWNSTATDIIAQKYFRKAGVPSEWISVEEDGIPVWLQRRVPAEGAVFGEETDARQVFSRLAGCWAYWGLKAGYFDADTALVYYNEMCSMLARQMGAPNSPQWFNTGLHWAYGITGPAQGHYYVDYKTGELLKSSDAYSHATPHACFINSVEDDLVNEGGIFDLLTREARIFKFGAGAGSNFSKLRGSNESLSGGGKSSGLMSFLRVGDRAAGAIKSGGTTRRAAKMVIVNADHPDIEEFVTWKVSEEQKVADLVVGSLTAQRHYNAILAAALDKSVHESGRFLPDQNPGLKSALREAKKAGLPGGSIAQVLDLAKQGISSVTIDVFDAGWNSEAYNTVSGQNSNNSIRVTDDFMRAVEADADWDLIRRTDGKVHKTIKANDLWDKVAKAAWQCADPGIQFDTAYNDWNTCPADGRINATNPCVTGDTLVSTAYGPRRIQDLVGGATFIVGADGKNHFVDKIFPTGKKMTYRLKTRAGYTLTLTGDHKVFTTNRGDVPASQLTKDDRIRLGGSGFGTKSIDPEYAFAIGAAIGDGCIGSYGNSRYLQVTMAHNERPIVEKIAAAINAVKAQSTDSRTSRAIAVGMPQATARFTTSTRGVIADFDEIAILDQFSENKAFKDAIYDLDKATIAAILRGLFTADGTVNNTGDKSQYISLDSTSATLLSQVQHLLLGFGIKSKLYENRRGGKLTTIMPNGKGGVAEYPAKEMHALRISRTSRGVFEREIGFHEDSAKARALRDLNAGVSMYLDSMHDAFASLTPLGEADVFDLTEPDTSHFVANGLVVHNCSEYAFLDDTGCNLASLNLVTFLNPENPTISGFDVRAFEKAVKLWTMTLDISVTMSQLPAKLVAQRTFDYRTLGLGYANLGTLLMRLGLPYDSDGGRNLAAVITAIEHGVSYRTSAELAAELGAFPRYEANKYDMLRVMRNHRRAAFGKDTGYENLSMLPVVYQPTAENAYLWDAARAIWDETLAVGELYGYRNAQVTCTAPTGTIGLLMQCDTTGIEPDFSLVKFKTLAGGGYFKIVNDSVAPALRNLGYTEDEITAICEYATGTATFSDEDKAKLAERGVAPSVIDIIEKSLVSAMTVDMAAGMAGVQLASLGFSQEEISAMSDRICGTMMLEGAPGLKPEHLPVFDCATKCGLKGTRYIAPLAHINMMAATQPFISGSISKTINMPNEATIEDIKDAYMHSWKVAIKSVALYRDGSKLSQPLSGSYDIDLDDETGLVSPAAKALAASEAILKMGQKKHVPKRAAGYRQKFSIGGHDVFIHTGEFEDGTLGEIFLDMSKEGAAFRAMMNNFAIAVSMGLQYGVPLQAFVDAFTFTRFEPNGPVVGHENVKMGSSIIDVIFRDLAITYLGQYELAHVPPMPVLDPVAISTASEELATTLKPVSHGFSTNGHTATLVKPLTDLQIAKSKGFEGEACRECGQMTLVRNGSCLKCNTCGATSGCS